MSHLFMESEASFSPCGKYRWMLSRVWDWHRPWLGWVMLNPSTADASADDQTIRRCVAFAQERGFGGINVTNLFMYRATDPAELATVHDPEGTAANKMIRGTFEVCPVVIAAWGVGGTLNDREAKVIDFIRKNGWMPQLHCLGKTKDGHPKHPLYLPASTPFVPFEEARAES